MTIQSPSKFPKDFLSCSDLSKEQFLHILGLAASLKQHRHSNNQSSKKDKTAVILSTKPSLRTRLSFEIALNELGINTIFMKGEEIELGQRESYEDTAEVISRYASALIVRSDDHQGLTRLAQTASISVINALTDQEHPCQALADFLTIREICDRLERIKLTYVGDPNNVSNSLLLGSSILGLQFTMISPPGYHINEKYIQIAHQLNNEFSLITSDDMSLCQEADILYTDTWISMGQDKNEVDVKNTFSPYQLNSKNSINKKNQAIPILHCLPAHQGQEISLQAFEVNKKNIFNQSENRLHAQKALLQTLLLD